MSFARPIPETRRPSRCTGVLLLVAVITMTSIVASAQTKEWRQADNPYQEDIEYTIGATFTPTVVIEGVRWHSFTIDVTDRDALVDSETVEVEVTLELENRRSKSAKVLIILLLEDADGRPLERIEVRPFKVGGNRAKVRDETAELPTPVIETARRAYLFLEILN